MPVEDITKEKSLAKVLASGGNSTRQVRHLNVANSIGAASKVSLPVFLTLEQRSPFNTRDPLPVWNTWVLLTPWEVLTTTTDGM